MLDTPSLTRDSVTSLERTIHETLISLCVVAIAAVPAFAGSMPTQRKDRAAASCMRLFAKMRADASMDTWRNRMKVWPCLKEAGGTSRQLAAVTSGQRP
jgi:hypothetical protein